MSFIYPIKSLFCLFVVCVCEKNITYQIYRDFLMYYQQDSDLMAEIKAGRSAGPRLSDSLLL